MGSCSPLRAHSSESGVPGNGLANSAFPDIPLSSFSASEEERHFHLQNGICDRVESPFWKVNSMRAVVCLSVSLSQNRDRNRTAGTQHACWADGGAPQQRHRGLGRKVSRMFDGYYYETRTLKGENKSKQRRDFLPKLSRGSPKLLTHNTGDWYC